MHAYSCVPYKHPLTRYNLTHWHTDTPHLGTVQEERNHADLFLLWVRKKENPHRGSPSGRGKVRMRNRQWEIKTREWEREVTSRKHIGTAREWGRCTGLVACEELSVYTDTPETRTITYRYRLCAVVQGAKGQVSIQAEPPCVTVSVQCVCAWLVVCVETV